MRRTGAWACVAGGAALAVLTAVGWWLGPGTGPAYRVPEVIDPGPVQPDGEYDREFTIENRSDRPLTLVGCRTC